MGIFRKLINYDELKFEFITISRKKQFAYIFLFGIDVGMLIFSAIYVLVGL